MKRIFIQQCIVCFHLQLCYESDYCQGVVQGLLGCLREEEDSVRLAAER